MDGNRVTETAPVVGGSTENPPEDHGPSEAAETESAKADKPARSKAKGE